MSPITYTDIYTAEWSESRPGRHGGPAGIDYYTAVYRRGTWADDGSPYAGKAYEERTVYISNVPGYRHVVVSRSSYPVEKSPLHVASDGTFTLRSYRGDERC